MYQKSQSAFAKYQNLEAHGNQIFYAGIQGRRSNLAYWKLIEVHGPHGHKFSVADHWVHIFHTLQCAAQRRTHHQTKCMADFTISKKKCGCATVSALSTEQCPNQSYQHQGTRYSMMIEQQAQDKLTILMMLRLTLQTVNKPGGWAG